VNKEKPKKVESPKEDRENKHKEDNKPKEDKEKSKEDLKPEQTKEDNKPKEEKDKLKEDNKPKEEKDNKPKEEKDNKPKEDKKSKEEKPKVKEELSLESSNKVNLRKSEPLPERPKEDKTKLDHSEEKVKPTNQRSSSEEELLNTCPKCEKSVLTDFILVLDRRWHNACFTCHTCSARLNEGYRQDSSGKLLCYRCYNKKRGKLCHVCKEPIGKYKISAMRMNYHPSCFKCALCTGPLEEGFYERNGKGPYCDSCDLKLENEQK